MLRYILVAFIIFSVYVVFVGSISTYTLLTGLAVSIILSAISSKYLITNERKLREPMRLIYLIYYFIKYISIIELRAHADVIKRIFTMDLRPGLVKVPVNVKSRYSRLLVMGSITNTPGTIVVDEKDDYFYVNWIDVKTVDPLEAKQIISDEFEKFALKILE
ncbi:MAG: Na+/H+ antiporter subunit E [Desulfurococcaceae archaeon]